MSFVRLCSVKFPCDAAKHSSFTISISVFAENQMNANSCLIWAAMSSYGPAVVAHKFILTETRETRLTVGTQLSNKPKSRLDLVCEVASALEK